MNKNIIKETIEGSLKGTMIFPKIVEILSAEGIESYHVDCVRHENRYYKANGESHVEEIFLKHPAPYLDFSAERVSASIKKVQAGKSNYHLFMNEIAEAGCVYYIVYLTGKRVIYFGRKGEMHVELFPGVKP